MESSFGFGKVVDLEFDSAIDRVSEELGAAGFGVLTDIDVAATMQKKLDVTMRPYRILGACNPSLAHQAIVQVPDIGLLLPCNVVVREDEEGKVWVTFLDPERMLSLAGEPALEPFAADVKSRLEKVASRI
jgi:uncharacterized protein (DUF302 family)